MPIRRTLATTLIALLVVLTAATTTAQAEDWATVEAAARQEGNLLVYSTTSRTATAAQSFQELTGIVV